MWHDTVAEFSDTEDLPEYSDDDNIQGLFSEDPTDWSKEDFTDTTKWDPETIGEVFDNYNAAIKDMWDRIDKVKSFNIPSWERQFRENQIKEYENHIKFIESELDNFYNAVNKPNRMKALRAARPEVPDDLINHVNKFLPPYKAPPGRGKKRIYELTEKKYPN